MIQCKRPGLLENAAQAPERFRMSFGLDGGLRQYWLARWAGGSMGSENRRSPCRLVLLFLLACTLSSCADLSRLLEEIGMPGAAGTEPSPKIELPTIIAVMPFQNKTGTPGAEERVRKEFYNLFVSKPYVDIELAVIDEKIVRLERETGRRIFDLKPQEICQAIGCDGLIFGNVTSYEKVYAALYSQLSATAEVWMVDAKTGKEVVHFQESVNYYEGDIPLTPLGAIMTALSTAANVRELQEVRMVNELAYKLTQKIPDPEGAPAIRRPMIRAVVTNVSEGPFGSGDIVKVGLFGEPGIVADFDLGNFKRGLPMHESQPGVYLGEYAALPGDNTRDMPIIAHLKRASGPESQWIYTGGRVTIDTTAPPKVANLRARSFDDRVELSWEYPANVPDLAGYLVLRSVQPLSGYERLAMVERNAYADRKARADGVYYYRVIAVDKSDNQSEFSAATTDQGRLAEKEPAELSGIVLSDTILSGTYSLTGQLLVPRGVSLTIGPGTTILAEKGAGIRVQGQLIVDGLNGQVRLFSRKDNKWTGIVVEGGQVEMRGFLLSGSVVGVTLIDTAGLVENAVITDNDTGISVSGTAAVVVRNCWVAGNKTGIELTGTGTKVLKSAIVRNLTGLSYRSFTGEVRDNIIVDNEKNILSASP